MNEKHEVKRFRMFCSLLVVFMMAGLFHVHHWNEYFFEIFPLKTAQVMGVADRGQLIRIADICKARNKHTCQMNAYKNILEQNNKDYVAAELLAETQHLSGLNEMAALTLKNYFSVGGDSVRANYIYARVNQALSNSAEAEKYFKKTIDMKPNTLQVNVTEDYVALLMAEREYKKAKKFIDQLRRKGVPSYFLSTEYTQINKILKRSS